MRLSALNLLGRTFNVCFSSSKEPCKLWNRHGFEASSSRIRELPPPTVKSRRPAALESKSSDVFPLKCREYLASALPVIHESSTSRNLAAPRRSRATPERVPEAL